jgi:hypothetical protein
LNTHFDFRFGFEKIEVKTISPSVCEHYFSLELVIDYLNKDVQFVLFRLNLYTQRGV